MYLANVRPSHDGELAESRSRILFRVVGVDEVHKHIRGRGLAGVYSGHDDGGSFILICVVLAELSSFVVLVDDERSVHFHGVLEQETSITEGSKCTLFNALSLKVQNCHSVKGRILTPKTEFTF